MKSKKIIISLVIIALALVPAVWWGISLDHSRANSTIQLQDKASEVGRTEISYEAKPSMTSLQQLRDEVKDVTVTSSKYGEYVAAIEGHKGGDEGKYWSFYVDGKMSDVGAGSYVQKGGEKIVWKFQKL